MVFKGFADGCEPAEPVFPGNPGVVDAELVAGQAQSVFLGPGRDFGDTFAKALFIPSLFPVIPDDTLRKLVLGGLQRVLYVVWIGRKGHVVQLGPKISAPCRALVREIVRRVKVEVVYQIGIV